MNNLAEKLESIFEVESVDLDQQDCEIVEFSPEKEFGEVMEHVGKKMAE